MKRILMVLTVALIMVAMLVASAAPAFAAQKCGPDRVNNNGWECNKGGGKPFLAPRGQS